MSHFLGPIHYLMMERVASTHNRERALAERAVEAFGTPAAEALAAARERFGYSPPEGPLEEAVGGANIHEYLSEQVWRAEASEAAAVEAVRRSGGPGADELIGEAAYEHGRSTGGAIRSSGRLEGQDGVQEVVLGLNLALLDGMPCDHATAVEEQGSARVVLRRSLGVHREAWERAGADVGLMAELLGRWCSGLVEALNPRAKFQRTVHLDGGVGWCEDELTL